MLIVKASLRCMRQLMKPRISKLFCHSLSYDSTLKTKIVPEKVVMSHSPLCMFTDFLDKNVLVSGQGPVVEIAQGLGFNNITTIDILRKCFPHLDVVDENRRKFAPVKCKQYFPPIEAVVLLGEPVRWETSLQLIIDVLLSNGMPGMAVKEIPYPHLPVLACNMDLLWMAEACMPRFGHGCFLHTLETLYQKISGRELKYTALVGKPSEVTYRHAYFLLYKQAQDMGLDGIKTIYCIGDNPESDIYGANLFDKYLQKHAVCKNVNFPAQKQHNNDSDMANNSQQQVYANSSQSILVGTGVHKSSNDSAAHGRIQSRNHNHRDFVLDPILLQPKYETQDVLEAVKLVFQKENII